MPMIDWFLYSAALFLAAFSLPIGWHWLRHIPFKRGLGMWCFITAIFAFALVIAIGLPPLLRELWRGITW
jgi:hypothetical protein